MNTICGRKKVGLIVEPRISMVVYSLEMGDTIPELSTPLTPIPIHTVLILGSWMFDTIVN